MTRTAEIYTWQYQKDLDTLAKEIQSYANEEDLWRIEGDIKNSGGTLALHLCGNLRHFFGAVIGGGSYVRDRVAEFAARNVPKEKILKEIELAAADVKSTLEKLSEKQLSESPQVKLPVPGMTVDALITFLHGHLNYHLGQVNYHRRLCQKAG